MSKIIAKGHVTIATLNDGKAGIQGPAGIDANLLDWVKDWNSSKTVIDSKSLITPKIFSGIKNPNNTLTGIALGNFEMKVTLANGSFVTERVNGIISLKESIKTFHLDTNGNVLIGNNNQFIRYNSESGEIEFGNGVSLNWINAINSAKEEVISIAEDAQAVADALSNKAISEKWSTKLTYIDANGIYTGTLSANTILAIKLNASQITAGTIDVARLNVSELKSSLITSANIEALTLNVIKGTIGGWSIDSDSIYRGTKNNNTNAFTNTSGGITIGSTGLRGYKWRLESNGSGSIAGGNISWDASGMVTFSSSVSLNWTNAANQALDTAKDYADEKKEEAIYEAATDASNKVNSLQIGGRNILRNTRNWTNTKYWTSRDTDTLSVFLLNDCLVIKKLSQTENTHFYSICTEKLEKGIPYTLSLRAKSNLVKSTQIKTYTASSETEGTLIGNLNFTALHTFQNFSFTFMENFDYVDSIFINTTGLGWFQEIYFEWIKLEKGTKATDWSSSPEDLQDNLLNAVTKKVRYIRDWLNGSNINPSNHWVQIKAFDYSGTNIALSKPVSGDCSDKRITNGDIYSEPYANVASGLKRVIVDLGEPYSIEKIQVWHFYKDERIFNDTKTEVSVDGNDWYTLFDSSIEGKYKETEQGVVHYVSNYQNAAEKFKRADNAANEAQASADNANIKLSEIANDNLLTPSEKHEALREWEIIKAEYATVVAQATTYGISSADYSNKYNILDKYLDPLVSDLTVNSTIVGNTFRINFKNYYEAKINLLKLVTDKAKANLDQTNNILTYGNLYCRGTAGNRSATRILKINDDSIYNTYSRGIRLTVIKRIDLSVVSDQNYDIYGYVEQRSALATALNTLDDSFLIIITSFDAVVFDENLSIAIARCGGSGLILNGRYPYALVGIPNIGKGNGIEICNGLNSTDPYAEIYTKIINGVPQGINTIGGKALLDAEKAKTVADNAQNAANSAKGTAEAANSRLNEWASDSIISPTEKTGLKQQFADIKAEYKDIQSQTSTYALSTSTEWVNYNNAYNHAVTALTKYTASTPENIIISTDYDNITTYYDKRQVILDKISKAAKNYADTMINNISIDVEEAKQAGINAKIVADAITKKASDENWETKLTYIDQYGIFTGVLSANTVNAVKINASQITAGIIDTARLNVGELKSSLITAGNIDALTLNVAKGKIGGWNIQSDNISIGSLNVSGQTTIQIRTTTVGSNGHIYGGIIKPYGITMTWYQASNAGHFIMGQIISGGTSVKTGFIGIQMMAWDGTEYFCLSANTQKSGSKEVYNRIAGWAFDNTKIWKNSVSLGSDGSIQNGTKWQINNDGSGRLANGNIIWDTAGGVTFGASVSLNWTNAANNALNSAKSYADTKMSEAITEAAADAQNKTDEAKEIAQAMAFGKMLYRDPTFFYGLNDAKVYNNTSNGNVTITRTTDNNAPNDSKQILLIKNVGLSSPYCGGFYFGTQSSYRKILITRIIAKIPIGRSIHFQSNSFGAGGKQKWLTPVAGTGDWCEYILKLICGTENFNTTNYFAITGNIGTLESPVEWRVAYATVFDVTSSEKYTTTIDANGIYTSTLNANQITAGTINADRIAAGSINASKLDAASIKTSIINTDYINGLTLNFNKGKIGGWSIGPEAITIGTYGIGNIPIHLRSVSSGSGAVFSGLYKPYGLTMTWHQNQNAGHFVFGQVMTTGSSVKTGFIGIQMMNWLGAEFFTLSANYTKSGSMEIYNRIAGWGFDNTRIWKNNVSLGADGSIQNSTRWQLNNDGSGRVANGNITWDATGKVVFSSSVSINWTGYAETKMKEAINAAATDATNKFNSINIGGRNYAQKTSCFWSTPFFLTNISNQCMPIAVVLAEEWKEGDTISVSFDYKYEDIVKAGSSNQINLQGAGSETGWTNSFTRILIYDMINFTSGEGIAHISYSFKLTAAQSVNKSYSLNIRHDYFTGKVYVRNFKVEKGNKPTDWSPAPEDIENKLTKITATGIYTGTVNAAQINIDSALIVGGSTYNGSISVRDGANAVKVTLDRNGINAVAGNIGGWIIASSQISKNSVILSADGSILNGSKWRLDNDGSGFVANGNVSWTTTGAVTITGTVNATSGIIGGFTISGNKLTNKAADSAIIFNSLSGASYVSINESIHTLLAMRADSARTAISIQTYAAGARGISIIANVGSTFAIESYGPHTFGQRQGEVWNAPGVLFSAVVKNSSTLYNRWGNGLSVLWFVKERTGWYTFKHNLGHTDYTVIATPYLDAYTGAIHVNCYIRVEYIHATYFNLRVVNADNGELADTAFTFVIVGRNNW